MGMVDIYPVSGLLGKGVGGKVLGGPGCMDHLIVARWERLPDAWWTIQAPEAICSILTRPGAFSFPQGMRWTAARPDAWRIEGVSDMPTATLEDGTPADPLGRERLDGVFGGEIEVIGTDEIALRFTLQNNSDLMWRDLYAWVDLVHKHTPFPQETYVHTDDGFKKFGSFGEIGGFAAARALTPEGEALRDALFADGVPTTWSPPDQVADPLRAVTTDVDGEPCTVGIVSPQALVLGGNETSPRTDLGVGFGDILPGDSGTAEVRICFVEGTLDDLLARSEGKRPAPAKCAAAPDQIRIRNPKNLAGPIPCERVPLGNKGDYKPHIVRLPDGDILVVAFAGVSRPDGKMEEEIVLWRSTDGGKTWGPRTVTPLPGREPFFSVLKDGTLFISANLQGREVRNEDGVDYGLLYRSTDGGRTWESTKVRNEDVPDNEGAQYLGHGRNVLELGDGTLVFGVSMEGGREYLWRSTDGGKTWDKGLKRTYHGVDFSGIRATFVHETVFWQAPCGDLLAIARMNTSQLIKPQPDLHPPRAGAVIPVGSALPTSERAPWIGELLCGPPEGWNVLTEPSDQYGWLRLFRSKDGGSNWYPEELGSYYGEMFHSILRLQDGRLLFTFTFRAPVPPRRPPLGVQAVVGVETDDGFRFDFEHDRIMLDTKTPILQLSGGGFGGTVQTDDGTLVTCYSYAGTAQWGTDCRCEVVRWRLP